MTNPTSSPQIVNDYVRKEITELLQKRGIYELGTYGWKGYDTYDREMIGHAMWRTDSLYSRFLDAHFSATHGRGPPPRMLDAWEQFLVTSGGDFEGLVEAARLSIGLTLLHQHATERDHYSESSFFQVHLLASMVFLSTAADRLRDLFIAAVFQINTGQYQNARKDEDDTKKNSERKAAWYNGPFYEAAELPVVRLQSSEAFGTLPALADEIFVFRSARNKVIHTVATELGRLQRELARKKEPDVVDENYSYDEVQQWQARADAEHLERVERDVTTLVEWYDLLIRMSNEVFIVENTLRRHSYVANNP